MHHSGLPLGAGFLCGTALALKGFKELSILKVMDIALSLGSDLSRGGGVTRASMSIFGRASLQPASWHWTFL